MNVTKRDALGSRNRRSNWGPISISWLLMAWMVMVTACSDTEPYPSQDQASQDGEDAGPSEADASPPSLDPRSQLLSSLAARVIAPSYLAFEQATTALKGAVDSYAVALGEGAQEPEAERSAVQLAWRGAMSAWQRLELLQLGPAGAVGKVVGGQSVRDEIYSWPTTNPCAVDQKLSRAAYEDEGFVGQSLVNVYGLDGLEYLLFARDFSNACPVSLKINRDGEWQALSEETIRNRRGAYAQVMAGALTEQGASLASEWADDESGFRRQFAAFGGENGLFEDEAAALNALFRAIFYLDTHSKDKKLALPMGLGDGCSAEACLELVESRWARHSKENLLANLEVVRDLFRGHPEGDEGEGAFGFSALLRAEGHNELANTMTEAIEAAVQAMASQEGSLHDLIANDPEGAQRLYDKVKAFTDQLKGAMVMALSLTIPQEASGDND